MDATGQSALPRMDARGRTALVTGASRGLGAGLARRFRQAGLNLAVCARTAPALADGEHVLAGRVDVRDGAALDDFARRAAERFGRIDLWVNNAGVLSPIGPLRDVSDDQAAEHVAANLLGVVHGTRSFVRHLHRRPGGGVLINVSSGAARRPYAGWALYCAAKAGVDRLTECVALEEAAVGLRAYSVAPGVIDTDMQREIRASDAAHFPEVERFHARAREGRFSAPEFVADQLLAIAFDPAARPDGVLVRLPDQRP